MCTTHVHIFHLYLQLCGSRLKAWFPSDHRCFATITLPENEKAPLRGMMYEVRKLINGRRFCQKSTLPIFMMHFELLCRHSTDLYAHCVVSRGYMETSSRMSENGALVWHMDLCWMILCCCGHVGMYIQILGWILFSYSFLLHLLSRVLWRGALQISQILFWRPVFWPDRMKLAFFVDIAHSFNST